MLCHVVAPLWPLASLQAQPTPLLCWSQENYFGCNSILLSCNESALVMTNTPGHSCPCLHSLSLAAGWYCHDFVKRNSCLLICCWEKRQRLWLVLLSSSNYSSDSQDGRHGWRQVLPRKAGRRKHLINQKAMVIWNKYLCRIGEG